MSDHPGIGQILREARQALGLTTETLSVELRLPISLLEAIEQEEWSLIPPGRERPLTRLVAKRLEVDLDACTEAFAAVPGAQASEEPHPRQELMERALTILVGVGSLALIVWLVVPGRSLKERMPVQPKETLAAPPTASALPKAYGGPYPVLGEVLPDVPINAEGILVTLRAVDTCKVHIVGPGADLQHVMQVSEPWRLRVKGPFSLTLDNAGVVNLLVAGRQVQPDRAVAESWTGNFDEQGNLQLPASRIPTDVVAPEGEDGEPEPNSSPEAAAPEKQP